MALLRVTCAQVYVHLDFSLLCVLGGAVGGYGFSFIGENSVRAACNGLKAGAALFNLYQEYPHSLSTFFNFHKNCRTVVVLTN